MKIEKKEHHRTGYDAKDIEIVEFTELVADYDDNGLLLREERFNHDGTRNTLTLNTYNGQNLTMFEQYDMDDILLQKTENEYDEQGRLAVQTNYFGDASDKYTSKYVYDDEGNLLRVEAYVNGEFDYVERAFTYAGGRKTSEIENDENGEALYSNSYQYNEKGEVISYTRDEVQNKDRRVYEFQYNEGGDRVKDLVYDYGMKLIAKVNRDFDGQHRLLGYVEEDLDNYREVKMEYQGDLVVKNSILDREGKVVSWAEYEYDETGKEVRSTEFARDEVNPENFRTISETTYVRQ